MNENLVSVVFDNYAQAESAAAELRGLGVTDSQMSIIARDDHGKAQHTDGAGDAAETAGDVGKGAVKGAIAGTLLGIAALAIPGVGPLVAAGAIAATAVPGAAVTGAIVGASLGGVAGLIGNLGHDKDESKYFEDRINQGGVFLSVNTSSNTASNSTVREIMYRHGGHHHNMGERTIATDRSAFPA